MYTSYAVLRRIYQEDGTPDPSHLYSYPFILGDGSCGNYMWMNSTGHIVNFLEKGSDYE